MTDNVGGSVDAAESELLGILQCTRDLVIRYDSQIRILFFNHAAERIYRELLGVTLELGLCTYDLFSPEQRLYWDGINQRVLSGESFTEELQISDQAGALRTYEVDYRPTRRDGAVVGFTTFARDVTEARAQEAALRERHKLESIGVLAGGVAHDFNNLLAAMLGNISLAMRESPPGTDACAYLRSAEHAALRGAELTRQLLSYAGSTPTAAEPVNLTALVEEMVQLLRASVPKNAILSVELAPRAAWVHGDRAQLQQVLMNLVTNGADAVGAAGGNVNVRVAHVAVGEHTKGVGGLAIEPGNYVVLEVTDEGCGMDESVQARMFDPFFSTKQQGRGLGLSAMLGILRSHRSGILVSSTVGVGTSFRVLMPEGTPPAEEPSTDVPDKVRFSGRALVADDEPAVLAVTCRLLESLGFEVTSAFDGIDALAKGTSELPSLRLVVLDLSMPGLGGRGVADALRDFRANLPVVFVSGRPSDDVLHVLPPEATCFLAKPFGLEDLRRALKRVLN